MSLSITETGVEPVTLDEAKRQCYIPMSDSDTDMEALLESIITGVRRYGEARTWRQLVDADIVWKLDGFPEDDVIEVPRPPLRSVTSVEYIDTGGDTQTLAASKYNVDTDSEPGRIEIIDSWPTTKDRTNAVTITYAAGYGDDSSESTVPEDMKIAMKMHIKFLYDNRDSYVLPDRSSSEYVQAPIGTEYLLDQYSARTP